MVRTDAYNAISSMYNRSMGSQGLGKTKSPKDTRETRAAAKPGASKADAASSAKTETPKLSAAASKLLDRLKEEHGDMDIMVSNYSGIDEAKDIMKNSTKDVAVLFTADELEEMAADPEKEKEMMANVDKAKDMSEEVNNAFGETLNENSQGDISRIGIEFKSDGSTEMFAELEKNSAQMQEKIDAARQQRAAEQKETEKAAEEKKAEEKADAKAEEAKPADDDGLTITENARPAEGAPARFKGGPKIPNPYENPETVKTVSVSSNSEEGLLMALKNVNWAQAEEAPVSGGNLSFSA